MRTRIYLVLFLLLLLIAGSAYICSAELRVHDVVVLGCEKKDPGIVVEKAQIAADESIFKLRFDEIRARINTDPYFEVQNIRYIFPDTVRISVEEKQACGQVQGAGALYLVDENGFILEKAASYSEDLPMVLGVDLETEQKVASDLLPPETPIRSTGTEMTRDTKQIDAMGAILVQLRAQQVLQKIKEIHMEEISDLYLTTNSGFEVRLGNFEKMKEKVRWLRAVEPVLLSEGYEGGVINVSTGENASFMPAVSQMPEETESMWQKVITNEDITEEPAEPEEGEEQPEQ